MSAIKIGQNYQYKEIFIKNTIKSPSYEYKPQFNPSSSFIRNRILQTKQKAMKLSPSGSFNSHTNNSLNDIKYRTFRASSSNKSMLNDSKKGNSVISCIKINNNLHVNNEYYSLPLVNQVKYKKITINKEKNNSRHHQNGNFLRISNNNSRQISFLNYNNNNDNSNQSVKVFHNKSQSVSYENSGYHKINQNNLCNNDNKNRIKLYKSILSKYSCKSKPGYTITGTLKTNQDSYMAKNKIFGLPNFSIFGVFDGHGVNGHFVSRFLKEYFGNFFTKKENYLFTSDNDITEKKCYERLSNFYFIKQACIACDEKVKHLSHDTRLSGSTGVIIAHIEDKIMCFNVGDSRAIYINEDFEVSQISKDHKPNLPEEQSRIQKNGGRVSRLANYANAGPFRVWLKREEMPGLAMSRSFGDFLAKSVGVICEPDFFELNIIENKIRCVILASDGLYEFISNESIAAMVVPFIKTNDCVGATKKLVEEAYRTWTKDGVICDDITVIVLFFKIEQ